MMGRSTDRGCLSDTGGERGPALSVGRPASVGHELGGVVKHGWSGEARIDEEESLSAPLPGAPNVGFRVPAKPSRFEHWGAPKDLSPSLARMQHDLTA